MSFQCDFMSGSLKEWITGSVEARTVIGVLLITTFLDSVVRQNLSLYQYPDHLSVYGQLCRVLWESGARCMKTH